jgi:hypothetical protein
MSNRRATAVTQIATRSRRGELTDSVTPTLQQYGSSSTAKIIAAIPIHFLHAPGTGPAPLPLILSHGWPWRRTVALLAERAAQTYAARVIESGEMGRETEATRPAPQKRSAPRCE